MKMLHDNGDEIIAVMTKKEWNEISNNDYPLHQQEEEVNVVDMATKFYDDNEPYEIQKDNFIIDKEFFQGIVHQSLNSDEALILWDDYYTQEEFQNQAIRYLMDVLLAHGLIRKE